MPMRRISDLATERLLVPSRETDALTEDDLATLRHLLQVGVGRNTLRAYRSDLAYLEAWSLACTGGPLPWPPGRDTLLRFVGHHLWRPEERARNPAHGMPAEVEDELRKNGVLRASGPHAPSTVRRRMATWRAMCRWRELGDPFDDPILRKTLAAACRAAERPRVRKSAKAVDGDLVGRLMAHLSGQCPQPQAGQGGRRTFLRPELAALRDRAMIGLAFASGGRRRSEISRLARGSIVSQPEIVDPETGDAQPSVGIRLGRTKTDDADDGEMVFMTGVPVRFLAAWLAAARIRSGPVFRAIDRWGNVSPNGLGEQGLNDVLKARLAEIGEAPAQFSAHGLRSGYITEALNRGLTPQEIMGQTRHRSMKTTMAYYNARDRRTGRAARLME